MVIFVLKLYWLLRISAPSRDVKAYCHHLFVFYESVALVGRTHNKCLQDRMELNVKSRRKRQQTSPVSPLIYLYLFCPVCCHQADDEDQLEDDDGEDDDEDENEDHDLSAKLAEAGSVDEQEQEEAEVGVAASECQVQCSDMR